MIPPTVFVHIFIHGTVLAGYFFLNPFAAWYDSYETNCSAFQSARAARARMTPSHAELVQHLGLQDMTHHAHMPASQTCAAAFIIHAFHQVFRHEMRPRDAVHYYTFGWSGFLSERERRAQAQLLYTDLIALQTNLQKKYPDRPIVIRMYGHSHGGQIIANLAPIVQKARRSGSPTLLFPLDTAFLCATPLIPHSVQELILSGLFRWIVNITSRRDRVQSMDIISTPGHFCTQRIEQLNVPLPSGVLGGPTYVDVEVTIENSPHAVNHSCFFSCTAYRVPSYIRHLRSIKRTIDLFRPLPILVWYPAIQDLMQTALVQPGYYRAHANIYRQGDTIQVSLTHGSLAAPTTVESKKYLCTDQSDQKRRLFCQRAKTAGWNHLTRLVRYLCFWG